MGWDAPAPGLARPRGARRRAMQQGEEQQAQTKRPKMSISMATHSGTFQCDEALGIWMLRQLPKWKGANLVRSRDNAVLDAITAAGGIVIDVGGRYNPADLRFDHHQRGFFETFDGEPGSARSAEEAVGRFKTKLSATGLVYKHFGKELLQALHPDLVGSRLEACYTQLYKQMIEGIDAIDNGIAASDELRYHEGTGLSSRIARLNPRWNDPKLDQEGEDARFEVASALAGAEFSEQLDSLVGSWLPARDEVEKALLERASVHSSAQVLCFPSGGMPWKTHLYELERQHSVEPLVLFVLYEDSSGMWRVQAVTVEGTSPLNKSWFGLFTSEI